MINIAHSSTVTGGVSELIATAALHQAGWQVCGSAIPEVFDRIGRHPEFTNNEWVALQIKTVYTRTDRKGAKVVFATKGDGTAYTPEESDYIVGVDGTDVWLIKNRNLREYWQPIRPTFENGWVLVEPTGKESAREAI